MRIWFNEGWFDYPRFPVCLTFDTARSFFYFSVYLLLFSFRIGWPNWNKELGNRKLVWNFQNRRGQVLLGNLRNG